jgi:hypothetical protein
MAVKVQSAEKGAAKEKQLQQMQVIQRVSVLQVIQRAS